MSQKIVDLTFTIHEGMTTFPVHWHPAVEISQLGRLHYEKRETRKLVLGTHTGTHMDAPRHFIKGGETIENLPVELFIGPCTLLDFTEVGPFGEVSASMMEEKLGGRRPERVMLRFDWCKNFYSTEYYTDHPYLSSECAQWMVSAGIKLIAMDTPMPDNPKNGRLSDNDSPNHYILLGNGVILVEYVTNLQALGPVDEFELIVLPLKIADGDGAPVRCIGRVSPSRE